MREKPDLPDARLIEHLREAYGLPFAAITFLPLGFDMNTASYRAETLAGEAYYLKLRKGNFSPISALVPAFLRSQGMRQVIAPVAARDGQPWSWMGEAACVLFPFIPGQNGFALPLTEEQWIAYGAALRALHAARLPGDLLAMISVETFAPVFRELLLQFLARAAAETFTDPLAAEMAALLRRHSVEIREAVERANLIAGSLPPRSLHTVLCHSDIHAGNLHLTGGGGLFLVDWDDLIIAPKERDLMYINGCPAPRAFATRESDLFYQGYGPVGVDRAALAYYYYEHAVRDIEAFAEQILLSRGDAEDRRDGLGYCAGIFGPGGEIALARRLDPLR